MKEARTRKKYSRARLEKETKIKEHFIKAIEKEDWQSLPEYPVVQGFVKSITATLKIDERRAMALLRRDYPPKRLRISPKPDVSDKFTWSPRFTFFVGAALISLMILVYLGLQYISFVSPPRLEVFQPIDGQVAAEKMVTVSGRVDPDAIIRVNNQPVLVGEDGDFTAEIEIFEGTGEIEIKAISRSGKETVVRRKIIPELQN